MWFLQLYWACFDLWRKSIFSHGNRDILRWVHLPFPTRLHASTDLYLVIDCGFTGTLSGPMNTGNSLTLGLTCYPVCSVLHDIACPCSFQGVASSASHIPLQPGALQISSSFCSPRIKWIIYTYCYCREALDITYLSDKAFQMHCEILCLIIISYKHFNQGTVERCYWCLLISKFWSLCILFENTFSFCQVWRGEGEVTIKF